MERGHHLLRPVGGGGGGEGRREGMAADTVGFAQNDSKIPGSGA